MITPLHLQILCLGNNTQDTDTRTRHIADKHQRICHGLLSDLDGHIEFPTAAGIYHSSIYDMEYGRLVELCKKFDLVIALDQPQADWSHPDAYLNTVRVLQEVSQSVETVFLDPVTKSKVTYWQDLVNSNPSLCIFPFIEYIEMYNYTTVCCRSDTKIANTPIGADFSTVPEYVALRKKMLAGQRISDHCSSCYKVEDQGFRSARQQETVEWATRLNLNSVDDLLNITQPAYYEIRPSNRCNLQCRMCGPADSHLLEKEWRTLGLIAPDFRSGKNQGQFNAVVFDNLRKLYVAGGEPMILPEFYAFLDSCIDNRCTDFEFLINTNGTQLSDKFKRQAQQFSNMQFIFSIDGLGVVNEYIRSNSCWDVIVDNWRYLTAHGHKVFVNTTVSIYNVATLHRLLEFVDINFPGTIVHFQTAVGHSDILDPVRFPNRQLALNSLQQCQSSQCYHNDGLLKNFIDSLYQRLISSPAPTDIELQEFVRYNSKLDQSRNTHLFDAIPEFVGYF